MKVTLDDMKIEMTLQELVDIINDRRRASYIDPTTNDGKEQNCLVIAFNEGVDLMAKYIGDYFQNEFDKKNTERYLKGV